MVSRRQPAVRRKMVMVAEIGNIDRDDQFGGSPWPDARNGQQASVGAVFLQQRGDLGIESAGFSRGLPDPASQYHDLWLLGIYQRLGDPRRRRDSVPCCVHLSPVRALRHGAEGSFPGIGDVPRATQLLEQVEPSRVGEVRERLEGRAGLQQDATQAIFVAGPTGDHVVALRRQ